MASVAAVDAVEAPPRRSAADEWMRRLLRIPDGATPLGEAAARQAFSQSMAISGLRCLLTYVLLPFVAPALGWASGIGPIPGLLIGTVAIFFNVKSIRRFWMADHRWRWAYTGVGVGVIALLLVLVAKDIAALLG